MSPSWVAVELSFVRPYQTSYAGFVKSIDLLYIKSQLKIYYLVV